MKVSKSWIVGLSAVAALAMLVWSGSSMAAGMKMEGKGHKATITGYVRDTGCFVMHGMSGDSHASCALMCAKNNVPLGIQADNGTYYIAIKPGHPASSANPLLQPYVEKKVKITGMTGVHGGQHVLAVMKVTPL